VFFASALDEAMAALRIAPRPAPDATVTPTTSTSACALRPTSPS